MDYTGGTALSNDEVQCDGQLPRGAGSAAGEDFPKPVTSPLRDATSQQWYLTCYQWNE